MCVCVCVCKREQKGRKGEGADAERSEILPGVEAPGLLEGMDPESKQ